MFENIRHSEARRGGEVREWEEEMFSRLRTGYPSPVEDDEVRLAVNLPIKHFPDALLLLFAVETAAQQQTSSAAVGTKSAKWPFTGRALCLLLSLPAWRWETMYKFNPPGRVPALREMIASGLRPEKVTGFLESFREGHFLERGLAKLALSDSRHMDHRLIRSLLEQFLMQNRSAALAAAHLFCGISHFMRRSMAPHNLSASKRKAQAFCFPLERSRSEIEKMMPRTKWDIRRQMPALREGLANGLGAWAAITEPAEFLRAFFALWEFSNAASRCFDGDSGKEAEQYFPVMMALAALFGSAPFGGGAA